MARPRPCVEAMGVEAKAEAEATFFGLEAEARPRGQIVCTQSYMA
jgi:hypothetical protein